ncbi:MAG: DUF4345 family protein [Alphaproteobacteria bacterium]|nr:DUF4345 family protein [Alphaproteobacteria bacterium]
MLLSLYLGFLLFAAMGGALLWQPQYLTRVTGLELSTVESRNEVRAVYGGFGIAAALALFIALVWSPLRGGICLALGLALIGMAAGRGYSAWLERPSNNLIWGLLGAESVLGLMLMFQI